MVRKAIVHNGTNRVVNIIEIEADDGGGFDHWRLPPGHSMVDPTRNMGIGGTLIGGVYTPPPPTAKEIARTNRVAARASGDDKLRSVVWTPLTQEEIDAR